MESPKKLPKPKEKAESSSIAREKLLKCSCSFACSFPVVPCSLLCNYRDLTVKYRKLQAAALWDGSGHKETRPCRAGSSSLVKPV